MSSDTVKLTKEATIALIRSFREKPALWDIRSELHKNIGTRNQAWEILSEEFDISVELLKKKMKALRTSYMAARRRVEAAEKFGSGEDDIIVPFYYKELGFLNNETSITNIEIVPSSSHSYVSVKRENLDETDSSEGDNKSQMNNIPNETRTRHFNKTMHIIRDTVKLNKQATIDLIHSYREKEALWNVESDLYKNLELKKQGWKELSEEFNLSIDLLKKKIKCLRTRYMYERKKVESMEKSGSNIYIPNLFYYKDMSFITSPTLITKIEIVPSNRSYDTRKKEGEGETNSSNGTFHSNNKRPRSSIKPDSYYNQNTTRYSDTVKLGKIKTIELIHSYREKEALWNVECDSYKNVELRRQAWEELSQELNLSIEVLKKKMKCLRTCYMSEKKKVDAMQKSGSTFYIPNLFYYKDMEFLTNPRVLTKMETVTSNERSYGSMDEEYYCEVDNPEPTTPQEDVKPRRLSSFSESQYFKSETPDIETHDSLKMSKETIIELIRAFRQKPALWDVQSESYKFLGSKKRAWEELSDQFGISVEALKKKMKSLRTSYMAERKKVEATEKSASGDDDIHVPVLFYYKEMEFLNNSSTTRNIIEIVPSNNSSYGSAEEDDLCETDSSERAVQKSKKLRRFSPISENQESYYMRSTTRRRDTVKLSKATTLNLIHSYREKEALWNVQSPLYKNLDLKKQAWEELSAEFNISIDMLKKKIHCLRTSYMAERRHVEAAAKAGSGEDEMYVPNLFYYKDMEFLSNPLPRRNKIEILPSHNSSYVSIASGEDEDFCETDTSEPIVQNQNKKRQRNNRTTAERQERYSNAIAALVETVTKKFRKEDDVFDAFGKSISAQLRRMPFVDASETMSDIQILVSRRTQKVIPDKESELQSNSSGGNDSDIYRDLDDIPLNEDFD